MAFRQLREPCVIALALRHALQGVIGGGLEAAHIAYHKPRARVIEVYTPGELVRKLILNVMDALNSMGNQLDNSDNLETEVEQIHQIFLYGIFGKN